MLGRRNSAALLAEFLGTGALVLLVLSVQRSTIGVPFFVAAAAGLVVALMSFTVGGASGGFFNPALTLGFWTLRRISFVKMLAFVAVEFLAAYLAQLLYHYMVKTPLQQVGGHWNVHIFVAEIVGTIIFGLGFTAAIYNGVTKGATAAFAGLALMVGIIAASPASIGVLNPAVAVGIKAIAWAYILGPFIGALIAINLFSLVFAESDRSPINALFNSMGSGRSVTSSAPAKKKKSSKKSKR
ncbi:MAG TPA: aquaporin [Candidatus Saccharimonadales bacterium]|nr:aquaporin [Candidatus Saccharimonadales bacterium]